MKSTTLLFSLLSIAFASSSAHAVPIAIVDSGTDLNHPELVSNAWVNPNDEDDAVDEDDNGYIDDVNGWNFAENNNKLFDKRYLGTFSKDVYKFFDVQANMLRGKATPEEISWMKAKVASAEFIAELSIFGNFVHGTHVAGIAAAGSPNAKIMGIKLMATKAPKPFAKNPKVLSFIETASKTNGKGDAWKRKAVLMLIDIIGKQQAVVFAPIATYVKLEGARVANCSFGTGYKQVKGMFGPLLNKIFGRTLPDAEMNEYIQAFIQANIDSSSDSFVNASPNTLFVIAAGNDGMNNDLFPASPANIKTGNAITVAATDGLSKLASFSNYGEKMVDIAAPGVAIRSAIPGGEYVHLSGTSQAAPHVANVAGQVLDANPTLTSSDVRRVLMDTVDLKPFLTGKVASGGIVNLERALVAAKYSTSQPLSLAITRAIGEIADQKDGVVSTSSAPVIDSFVQPLPAPQF